MSADIIKVTGARQHNLQNISLEIPRNQLVVITGVSGSGKSSLAFHTLYAEGQRRYVESLSAYARQFLEKLEKPDVDFIEGLSPAIAIEQRTASSTPRSTIATVTEIYDYLRILYAALGQPHDPETGEAIHQKSVQSLVEELLELPSGTRLMVLGPIELDDVTKLSEVTNRLRREGFVRVRIDGEIHDLEGEFTKRKFPEMPETVEAVVDRLVLRDDSASRLTDSIETALKWSRPRISFLIGTGADTWDLREETTAFANPETGFTLETLTPRHFSFNSHLGACETCQGLGTLAVVDPDLIVTKPEKGVLDGAFKNWWVGQKKVRELHEKRIQGLAKAMKADLMKPFEDLAEPFQTALLEGSSAYEFEGLAPEAARLLEETESQRMRQALSAFTSDQTCPDCQGQRLIPEILGVTLADTGGRKYNIAAFTHLSIQDALAWVEVLQITAQQAKFIGEVRAEITKRLHFLNQVGLGYLTLDRESRTLSGGESQRIRLATQIGAGLTGVLYVLDEPSIGLHQRDNARLLETLQELKRLGNSVIVVEHDEETIEEADHVIDIGPGAGSLGGKIIAQGTVDEIKKDENSITGKFLTGRYKIKLPKERCSPRGWVTVYGGAEHNLKDMEAQFPIGCLTCVTGVSGSGKSTLVDKILRRALFRHFYHSKDKPGKHEQLSGLDQIDKAIVVDQAPIGRSPRSNPATYVGAFNAIRDLFAGLPASKIRGYSAGRFSFNRSGGRCEHCQGDGLIRIDMHFLNDVYVTCETCNGKRYNRETLEVTFKGKTIAEVLELSVSQGTRFFRNVPAVHDRLETLEKVGLGYVKLGQPGTSLSGGEAQRVKLAAELAKKATGRTLYLLDEPTTGLHFSDVDTLLRVLYSLRDAGNTLVVIEHNLDMIKCADWVIDLGPEGGEGGGSILAAGPPEEIVKCKNSYTGRYLKRVLER